MSVYNHHVIYFFQAIGASFVAMIGAGIVVRSIPYKEGFGAKQLAWVGYSSIMGAIVAPLCMLGGPLLVRAAWYTAGVVGGMGPLLHFWLDILVKC